MALSVEMAELFYPSQRILASPASVTEMNHIDGDICEPVRKTVFHTSVVEPSTGVIATVREVVLQVPHMVFVEVPEPRLSHHRHVDIAQERYDAIYTIPSPVLYVTVYLTDEDTPFIPEVGDVLL